MEEFVKSIGDWATALIAERWAEIAVGVVMIALWRWFMGHKYQKQIDALKARPPITVNTQQEERRRTMPPVEAKSSLTMVGRPEERLRALASAIEPFTRRPWNESSEIWPVHIALGELGVPWPGPGIDWKFRQRVSALLLEACREGDMEAARSAWARAREQADG